MSCALVCGEHPMSTLSHQPKPSSSPTWVTHVPASSWAPERDHAPQDTAFLQPQAQPQVEEQEQELEPAEPLQAKEFTAAPTDPPPPDPPESPLQRSERLGHQFQHVSVLSDRPPLQPKLSLSLSLIQPQGSERPGAADGQLESQLSQSKGGGSPLDPGTQQFMESRFAQDFSGVRVHTNASAVQMNQQIQAQAFTHGQDIYFGAGKFDTGSTPGKQLLAHELTHTVQQMGSKPLQAKPDREGPLVESGHIPGMMMAYGLQQEANWMQRAGEGFHNPGLVIQRSPDSVQVHQSTQGQEQISGGFLDWVLPKELVQAKEMLGTILKGASGVLMSILKNPVGFLGNLIAGLKSGFQNFLGNIGQYLQSGLVGWLTGALGSTGIEMPQDVFSLKGMFSLVMQVLGATWTQVRTRIVSAIPGGEQAMAALEEGTEIFQIAMKEGVGGLWEYVKDQFGDIKSQVMGQIQDMVVMQGIQKGIEFILSMLSPVTGLVKAAMSIYEIVRFFIERGSQVASLVEAVIGSIKAVANGAVAEAAKLVESALGRSIPVLIGFLSSVAGLGNLASKVQGIFQKMRQPVDKAVNWLIKKAKDLVLNLGRRLGLVKDDQQAQGQQNGAVSEKDHPKLADQAITEMKGASSEEEDYGSLRKILETKAKQVEKTYTGKLKPGINLRIEFQDAEKDKEDNDIDFEVIIAPNDTRKKGAVEVDGPSPLIVGLHKIDWGGSDPRESHHVPAAEFANTVLRQYDILSKELDKIKLDGAKERQKALLNKKLKDRVQSIDSGFPGEGKDRPVSKNLSAILLHEETHRSSDVAAVHGVNIATEVLNLIREQAKNTTDGQTQVVIVMDEKGKRRTVPNLQKRHWKKFVASVHRILVEGENIKSSSDNLLEITTTEKTRNLEEVAQHIIELSRQDEDGNVASSEPNFTFVENHINQLMDRSFNSALVNGVAPVRAALVKSNVDGPKGKHSSELTKLEGLARQVWRRITGSL